MRLRKECEHGYYDEHPIYDQDGDFGPVEALRPCPGGEFLPEGALVIEKVDGEWPLWVYEVWPSDQVGVPAVILNALLADRRGS